MISPQITLWNQQGSEVIQGTLLVIPIEESLLYIRPLYLRGQGGRIPELKRVIVAYQGSIVMEPTLEGALARLFGSKEQEKPSAAAGAATPAAPSPQAGESTMESLLAQARDHYDRAIAAQRDGDWARYGEEIRKLGEALQACVSARSEALKGRAGRAGPGGARQPSRGGQANCPLAPASLARLPC